MARQQMYQRYIFKIHSRDILKSKNKTYELSIEQARQKQEIITIADSQLLRFIDDINRTNREDNNILYHDLHRELKRLRKENCTTNTRDNIKKIYAKLEKIQLVRDYLCVTIDKPDDIYKLDDGFMFNGQQFKRLVGTPNGVKKSTIIYTSLWEELDKRMNCGRNLEQEIVPAKFEAYKSLVCSSSIPLSFPKGVVVVPDLELNFMAHAIELKDAIVTGTDPFISEKDIEVELNANDGFGLISPALSEKWSEDLKLSYRMSGCCLRNAFVKGMVYTFDFHAFAHDVAHTNVITDVWGTQHNINNVELILTASMAKLWDSYSSYKDYEYWFKLYGYTYSATKVIPKKIDNERTLNYQFIQSYNLTDEQIYDLISPTVNEIKSVIHNDINKTILFLRGLSVTDENVLYDLQDDYIKALMIDERMINDPYIIDKINRMIKKRINDAKIGVVSVHGNYQLLSGDPYALCQSMFGLLKSKEDYDKCGLLKADEVYSHYWISEGVKRVCCFRAPMSSHSNIKVVNVVGNDDMKKWYQYMSEVFIINAHDTLTHCLNGADCDGDILFSTNNPVLLANTRETLPIVCVQKKAEKKKINQLSLIQADSNGFGNSIGAITNRITAMYDVQSKFNKDSEEYKALDFRIKCGQLYQQNEIDKIKGIISDPMPKSWYIEKNCFNDFERRICACKKPYFMIYIYPELKEKYKSYLKKAVSCGIFDFSYEENILGYLSNKLETGGDMTEEQRIFIKTYIDNFPVFDEPSTMNRLCHIVENELDNFTTTIKKTSQFDYNILKSDSEYSRKDFNAIKKLYQEYKQEVKRLKHSSLRERNGTDIDSARDCISQLAKDFQKRAISICPDEDSLCNIVLDLCYTTNESKEFAWQLCGDIFIKNLLRQNNNKLNYLVEDTSGSILYKGYKFSQKSLVVSGEVD